MPVNIAIDMTIAVINIKAEKIKCTILTPNFIIVIKDEIIICTSKN